MKTIRFICLTSLLFFAGAAAFSQARVQFIHNSADAAAEVVDIWVDQGLVAQSLSFRDATAFLDVPAGQQITVAVTEPGSPSPNNPLWSQSYTLNNAEAYIFMADGILSTTGYDPAPPFGMQLFPSAREVATMSNQTDVLFHHASTDAPTIDIYETGVGLGLWVDDLSYTGFNGYQELATKDYMLEVRDAAGSTSYATYRANFQTLGWKGYAINVVASGFFDPSGNSNGPAFGLWAALAAGGPLVELPLYDPKARLQFIHNSADAAISTVGVWFNQTMLFGGPIAFRSASAFIDIPALQEFTLSITAPGAPNPNNPVWSQTFTLDEGKTYLMVAEGITSPTGYDPAVPFDVALYTSAQEAATNSAKVDMLVHHSSTDAPVIDMYETAVGLGLVTDNLAYAGFDGYHELSPLNYIFEVRDQSGTSMIAAYRADFQTMGLDGEAVTMVTSGFLDPSVNSSGPAFGLWLARPAGGPLIELPVFVPTARAQLIHNSADALTEVVDVWLNDVLVLDNLAFRTASPFLDVPAGQQFTLAVTDADAAGPENPLWSQPYTLIEDTKYILVAEGILSPNGYDPVVPFDVAVFPLAREQAIVTGQTDVLLHHGSTDCPTMDVIEVGLGIGTLANDLAYSQFAGYLNMATVNYIFQIKDYTGMNKIAAFQVPLGTLGLQGDAVTILTSGFLEPGSNSNGPDFGLWLAQASGGALIKMPVYDPTARVQIIHNSADTALSTVDVWIDNELVADNLDFRSATAFLDAPAIEDFMLSVCSSESQNPYTPLWAHNFTLTEGETYVMVAEGIVSGTGFDPNVPFDVAVYPGAREVTANPANTDMLFNHGSTDAPASIDIFETKEGGGLIFDNLAYAGFAGYLEWAPFNYVFEVRDQSGTVIGAYYAALQTFQLGGEAITVVASGFVNPGVNSNGAAFGLWAARASGGPMVEFPVYAPMARVQIIHNSADEALAVVDVWMDQTLLIDNFEYRTATPYMFMPALQQITIAIKGPDSQDPGSPLWSGTFNLMEEQTYVWVADGIISASGYDPATPFDMYDFQSAREVANNPLNTDILTFHGSTDAPQLDIFDVATGQGQIVDNILYGSFVTYLEAPTANFSLDVMEFTGAVKYGNFAAPFADMGLDGQSLTLLVSGFLEPASNSNGAAFGLMAVLSDGTAWMLTNTSGMEDHAAGISALSVYPNPAAIQLNISFDLKKSGNVVMEMTDITGRSVSSLNLGILKPGKVTEQVSVGQLPPGIYMLNIRTGDGLASRKVLVK